MKKTFINQAYNKAVGSLFKISQRWGVVLILFISLAIALLSCKKFLELDPPKSKIKNDVVFSNDATASAAVLGIYSELYYPGGFACGDYSSVLTLSGLSADELVNYSRNDPGTIQFDGNELEPSNPYVGSLWNSMYKTIYQANAVIEGLNNSIGVTPATKKQLLGEAYFIRAFTHFYLVNLFGDVPLVLSTDYQINSVVSRTQKARVYDQIKEDLLTSREKLAEGYFAEDGERIRANKFTASAMLARVYLYLGQWAEAETMASEVINNTSLYGLTGNLIDVFLKNSTEAIWQLRPNTNSDGNNGYTLEAHFFSPSTLLDYNVFNDALTNAFGAGDLRKTYWVDSIHDGTKYVFFPRKYKQDIWSDPLTEYSMVIRLAELYLIRAEARTEQNNISGAQADINVIRNRALLGNTGANDKASLLTAIEQERKVELFTEWGHRWLDLKRWNKADAVLAPMKGPTWQSTDVLYPLPQSEMDKNPNLTPQNAGY